MSNFDFNITPLTGLPGSGKKNLDIYFQPALALAYEKDANGNFVSSVKGIAMLFLENDPPDPQPEAETDADIQKQDFREMVKILARWAWAAYWKKNGGTAPSNPTLANLEDVFEAFASEPLKYSELETFLSAHFNFRIQEYVGSAANELEATVFPIFPHLHLKTGNTEKGSFSPAGKKLNTSKINKLKGLTHQFKSRFDAGAQNSASTIEADYIPEFLFTGYFRMLIRSALQEAIHFLKNNPGQNLSLTTLLHTIDNGRYQDIAGMASTFLLNGFRVPAEIFGQAQGLYEATGQQFTFEEAKVDATPLFKKDSEDKFVPALGAKDKFIHYPITIKNPNGLTYLKTKSGGSFTDFTYRIDQQPEAGYALYTASLTTDDPPKTVHEEITFRTHTYQLSKLAQELKAVASGDFPPSQPEAIKFYTEQNMNFALRQAIDWDNNLLLALPSSLNAHLLSKAPGVDVHIWPDGDHKIEAPIPHNNFRWVSMIKFTVKRIPDAEGKGFLPHTYEIVEGSDEGLNRLEDIFNFLKKDEDLKEQGETDPVELHLAFAPSGDAAGLRSLKAAADDIKIFRSNLSTNTAAVVQSAFSATLKEDPNDTQLSDTEFLRLIWEGCTVASGGYFLHVQHNDPEVNRSWFGEETTEALHLIIEFTKDDDPIHPFNNAVLLKPAQYQRANPETNTPETHDIDMETDLVLARSSAMAPVLVIPPGHMGFRLVRDIPEEDLSSAKDEAANLYHMLGFGLAADTNFKAAESNIPIGPTILKGPPDKWLYERLVPAYTLWDPVAPDARKIPANRTSLPPKDEDPYLGINQQATLPVDCWWQDIYGNQLNVTNSDGRFPVRYTDPLIGLNQWPSVHENFRFQEVDDDTIALNLEFSFDLSSYPDPDAPENTTDKQNKRLQADLLTYRKIYYQLIQEDISLSVTPAVDTAWSISTADGLDNETLIGFVAGIYEYLSALAKKPAVAQMPPRPVYTETFLRQKSAITLPEKFIFEVLPTFTIRRSLAMVHHSLKKEDGRGNVIEAIQEKHEEVLFNTAYLTPKIDTLSPTDTTRDFAFAFEQAFPDLRLATGEDRLKKKTATEAGRPFFAVQLGTTKGISYDISEQNPAYFALPPLSNTLFAGEVPVDNYLAWNTDAPIDYSPVTEEKLFEAIDLNVLAREFLVAVEQFLEPESLVAAMKVNEAMTGAILTIKSGLAATISNSLDVILLEDQGTGNLAEAKNALKRELLVHLVKGYDIETAVQFQVEITVGNDKLTKDWSTGKQPRIRGAAVVKNVWLGEDPEHLALVNPNGRDFTLSAGSIGLQKSTGPSTFTYLFDTKTPEKFASIHLELEFRVTEIEHEIENVPGISGFQASNWLSLVLPENLNTYRITDEMISEARRALKKQTDDLSLFEQALKKLKASGKKSEEYTAQAELDADIKADLTAAEYAFFKAQLLPFAMPGYGITRKRMEQLVSESEEEIQILTGFQDALEKLRTSGLPGKEFPTQSELETGLITALGADTHKSQILQYTHAFYRAAGSFMVRLEGLIEGGKPELRPVQSALNTSKIKDLEFLSLNGWETGLRKELGEAVFSGARDTLLGITEPIYRIQTAVVERLEQDTTIALSNRQLFQSVLLELQSGPLFGSVFPSRQAFEAAVKKELGTLSYNKYKALLLPLTQPLFQITEGRLGLMEASVTGEGQEDFLQLIKALRSSTLKGRKFFDQEEFEKAIRLEIGQEQYDKHHTALIAHFNPYRITDGLLDGLQNAQSVPGPDWYEIVLQNLRAGKWRNHDFVLLADFENVLIQSLGNALFGRFREQLQAFGQPFFRMDGAMIQDIEAELAFRKEKHGRAQAALTHIETGSGSPKGQLFFSLEALDAAFEQFLGEAPYQKFKDSLMGLKAEVFRISRARLEGLSQQHLAELNALLQLQRALQSLSGLPVSARDFLTREELKDAIRSGLSPAEFELLGDELPSLVTAVSRDITDQQRLQFGNPIFRESDPSQPVFRITDAMVDGLLTRAAGERAALGELDGLLAALETGSLKTQEFLTQEAFETAIKAHPGTGGYETFREQVIHFASPPYRLEGAMLTGLREQYQKEDSAHEAFVEDMADLKARPAAAREYATWEELERGFRHALKRDAYDFDAKERRFQMFMEQNLAFASSVFQLGDTSARIAELEGQIAALEPMGEALEQLRSEAFREKEFSSSADLEAAAGLDGLDPGLKDQLKALSDPVLRFTIPKPSADARDEFSEIKRILIAAGMDGRNFASRQELEDEIRKALGQPDYLLFRNLLPQLINPNYMGKSPVPIPLRDYPAPPSLIFQAADVDESSRTDLEDIRQWEYSIIYEHEDIAQDSIDCMVQLNVLPPAITLSSDTISEGADTSSDVLIGTLTIKEPDGNNLAVQAANLSLSGADAGSFQIVDNALGRLELQFKKDEPLDYETQNTFSITITATHPTDARRSYRQDFTINVLDVDEALPEQPRNLYQALVNFNETYPELAKHLALLKDNDKQAKNALLAFKTLSGEVANAWKAWIPQVIQHQPGASGLHYVISEEPFGERKVNDKSLKLKQGFILPQGPIVRSKLGADDPEPLLALPKFQQEGEPVWDETPMKTYTFLEDPLDQTFFGDSLIPDRKFTIENLDVIEHQNAWAAIWLSRNKILLAGHTTNPKFIFQTPAVRFTNAVSPFITNDEPWDLATLHSPNDQAEDKTLLEHMQLLVQLIAPDIAGKGIDVQYEARLSCRYAFALAMGKGLNVDLKPTLPLLMGLRLNPTETLDSGEKLLAAYPKMLADEIELWLRLNEPSRQNASLIFSVSLFSKLDPASLTSLPMLRIKQMELKLENISDKNQ